MKDSAQTDKERRRTRERGKEGKRERGKEGKRERGKAGKRERGKEGKRERGKEGKRERGKEGKKEKRKRGKEGNRELEDNKTAGADHEGPMASRKIRFARTTSLVRPESVPGRSRGTRTRHIRTQEAPLNQSPSKPVDEPPPPTTRNVHVHHRFTDRLGRLSTTADSPCRPRWLASRRGDR
eukprot:GHVU01096201.1.p1 GENE.GHVU01096201.1~~GHVU01096201.1.p1  ORF type:complete len:181 (-),score=23.14 GHVU01096201.1:263-805(-)